MTQGKGWIGVDLDGTLARYDGWVNELHIGAPVPAMLERVKAWLAEGREVRIFTARVADGAGNRSRYSPSVIRCGIENWCLEHIGQALPVTCSKDFGMIALYDDRCVQIERNTGRALGQEELIRP